MQGDQKAAARARRCDEADQLACAGRQGSSVPYEEQTLDERPL